MSQNRSEIGSRIVLLRGEQSQSVFAARISIHKNTLGNYERGRNAPDAEFLSKLAAIGVNTHWVITGVGPMYIDNPAQAADGEESVVVSAPIRHQQPILPINEDLFYEVIQLLRSDESEVKQVKMELLLDDVVTMYNIGAEYSNDKRQQRLRLELRLNRRNQVAVATSIQFLEDRKQTGELEENRLKTVEKVKQRLWDLEAEETQLRAELQKHHH